jgi:hypothetical protein
MLFEVYREQGVSTWIEATGWSMSPVISPGNELFVEFGVGRIRTGEIALFALGDTIVSHRVVGWRGRPGRRRLLTKGDAVMRFDPVVAEADVLGAVRALRSRPDAPSQSSSCRGQRARALAMLSLASGLMGRAARTLPGAQLAGSSERLLERVAGSLLARVADTHDRTGTGVGTAAEH